MSEETVNRIKEASFKVESTQRLLNEYERELNELYLKEADNFVGSYVEYDGRYMRVERQFVDGVRLALEGPVLEIDVDALDGDGDEVMRAVFCGNDRILLSPETVRGVGPVEIRKLPKNEMEQVFKAVNASLTDFFEL